MKIDITNLLDGNDLGIDFNENLPVLYDYNLTKESILIKVSGKLTKVDEFYIFEGNANTKIEFCCDFCLKATEMELSFFISERFSKELIDYEEDVFLISDNKIDFTPAILTNFIINFPMRSLCSTDCKGLCKKCGKNLNHGQCSCDNTHIDTRFEKLYSLFDKKEV